MFTNSWQTMIKVKTCAVKILVLLFLPFSFAYSANTPSRDERENMIAEMAIIESLYKQHSKVAKDLCSQAPLTCEGVEKAELGMALIGVKNTLASMKNLAELVKYKMDGGLSTDYMCYVLQKKKAILTYVDKIDFNVIQNTCHEKVQKMNNVYREDVGYSLVCRSQDQMQQTVEEIKGALMEGKVCDSEDF